MKDVVLVMAAVSSCGMVLGPSDSRATTLFSADYAGIAQGTAVDATGHYFTFSNAPITGTFSADTSNCTPISGGGIVLPSCFLHGQSLSLTYNSQYFNGQLRLGGALVSVDNAPAEQKLSFVVDYSLQPYDSMIDLAGPANAFINGANFQSLHPGPVDVSQSDIVLNFASSGGATVALTSFTFVPEPASACLLAGFAMVGLLLRSALRRAETVRPARRLPRMIAGQHRLKRA